MTAIPDVSPIVNQACRNRAAGWSWCLLRPSDALKLAACAEQLADAERRLAAISAIIENRSLPNWACNYRDALLDDLNEIGELAKTGP